MKYFIGFLIGSASSLFWQTIPHYFVIVLLFASSFTLMVWRRGLFLSGLLFGVGWIGLFGQVQYSKLLNDAQLGEVISVVGVIDSLTIEREPLGFVLNINRNFAGRWFYPKKIKLNWYEPQWSLKQGQEVRLKVKLKSPFGLANEGAFAYQTWLMSQSIIATGYVVSADENQLLTHTVSLRQNVLDHLVSMNLSHVKWILALSIGYRGLLDTNDWVLMQETGLAHLIAISGLHLAVAFGVAYFVLGFLLSAVFAGVKRQDLINVHYVSLVGALVLSLGYSFLAGFSVPTVRAWIALFFVVAMSLLGRHMTMLWGFVIAMSGLILVFPASLFSVSFWLSAIAVAAILFSIWRLGSLPPGSSRWQKLIYGLKIQGMLTVLVTPLVVYQFGNVPLYSLVFNLILVPLVSVLLVPACLLGTFILLIFPNIAKPLFWLINSLFKLGFDRVYLIWESATLAMPVPHFNLVSLLFVLIAIIWSMLPALPIHKAVASLFLLPLVFDWWRVPEQGWFLHVLDVGQGLSVVIEKNNRVMIYDTGPAFKSGFNMAQAAILPFLKARGINRIDHLFLSHDDNDHSGGQHVLMPFVDMLTSQCRAGTQWHWQGIQIDTLWPPNEHTFNGGNESSCVLMLSDGNVKILLPGDIEKAQERQLVLTYGSTLKSDILLVPHHGSSTSSTRLFLRHVRPDWAIFSRGYENRWGFPKPQVIESYRKNQVNLLDTVENGQVSFHIHKGVLKVERFRQQIQPYWYRNFPF